MPYPYKFPETMIAHDPNTRFERGLLGWGAAKLKVSAPKVLAACKQTWRDLDTIRGMCAGDRAALRFDFYLDERDPDFKTEAPRAGALCTQGAMKKRTIFCKHGAQD